MLTADVAVYTGRASCDASLLAPTAGNGIFRTLPTVSATQQEATYPAGTYGGQSLSGAVSVIGAGIDQTIFQADSLDSIIQLGACSSVEIAYCTIQGNYSRYSGGYYTQMGIRFAGDCPSVHIHHVKIVDCSFCGIINDLEIEVSGTFEYLDVSHCGDFGVQFRLGAHDLDILDSVWDGFASRQYPGHAIYCDDVNGALIARHTISNLPASAGKYEISGVKVTRETDTPNTGIIVEDVTVDTAICAVSTPYAKNVLVRRCYGTNIATRGTFILYGADNVDYEDCEMTVPTGTAYLIESSVGTYSGVSFTRCDSKTSSVSHDWDGVSVTESANSWN